MTDIDETMTLGQLIEACERSGCKRVAFDFCYMVPRDIGSWRGRYDELSIRWMTLDEAPGWKSMADFLKMLRSADGETFHGWKGGEYTMSRDTKVWVDNAGSCTMTAIVGTRIDGEALMLMTGNRGW